MLVLLLPLNGFLLYQILRCLLPRRDWRELLLAMFVTMGVLITVSTELLGVFHVITGMAIRTFWLSILIILLLLIYRYRTKIDIKKFSLKIGSRFEWAVLFTLSIYFLVTLFIALVAPPNTNDSLQYHMSRVMHWIVNQSVDYYATPIDRQLWIPPFAEYSILHLFLLVGNDRFVNLVQWFSMAGSVAVVTLIAGIIGVKPRGQWFAALFAVTVPMGILQSTSTQTDYAAGFWCLCVFYYILLESRNYLLEGKKGLSPASILLGFSFSLAILTKGTVYAVVFPMFLCFLIVLIRKHLWKAIAGMVMIGGVCVFLLNVPVWLRNYSVYGSVLGPGAGIVGSSSYAPELVFSTALKNVTNQLAMPVGPGNKAMYMVVENIHEILGLDINDPRTSFNEYRIRFSSHEDFAGNPGHFLFGAFSIVLVALLFVIKTCFPHIQTRQKVNRVIERHPLPIKPAFFYALILIAEYFLFALLFKWQSYNSRLFLPWLIAIAPLAGWVTEAIRSRTLAVILIALYAIGGLPFLLANPSRPLISVGENKSILFASRTEVQFYNSPEIRDDFISVVVAAEDYDCGSIGLELDSSTPEYLIWYILAATDQPVYRVDNFSSTPETIQMIDTTYRPCVVFCITCTATEEKGYQQVYNRGSLQLYIYPHK